MAHMAQEKADDPGDGDSQSPQQPSSKKQQKPHKNQKPKGTPKKKHGKKGGTQGLNVPPDLMPRHMRPVPCPPLHAPRAQDSDEAKDQDKALWRDPKGWNLRVVCRDGTWVIHQEVLEREAPGFFDFVMKMATTDGTKKDGKDILTIDLSDWHPSTVGSLLNFLYVGDWKDLDGHPPSPTNLRSVRFHVEMAAQAWTLDFPTTVRETAVAKINLATFQLNNAIVTMLSKYPLAPTGYASVEEPLYRTVEFLYRQEIPEAKGYLMPVRAAIARLLDVALPWLLKQPAFVPRFQTLWSEQPMYGRYMGDHHKLCQLGCLLPSWDDPPEDVAPEAGGPSDDEGIREEASEEG